MRIKQFLQRIRGMSENTKTAYEQTLILLHHAISGDEPTDDEIRHFLGQYPTSSMHRHKAAIKAYYEWRQWPWTLGRREFPVVRQGLIRYVNPETVAAIAESAGNKHDEMFVKTSFQLATRISELLNITAEGISPDGVRLKTKGGHHKIRPITKEFYQELSQYVGKKKGRIFSKPYTYYYKRLKALGAEAGVPDISPHMLRHSRAVDLLRKGMSPVFVQQFLGHAQFNTTARYLEITGGELATELEKIEGNGHREDGRNRLSEGDFNAS